MTTGISDAVLGYGAKFYRYNTTSSAYEAVAEISEIAGPNKSKDAVEVTTLDSADRYKEFISGLKDGGQIQLTMNYTKATYQQMDEDFESDDRNTYMIVLPDEDEFSFEFEGIVTELGLGAPVGDKISADCTIKISGKPEAFEGSSGAL